LIKSMTSKPKSDPPKQKPAVKKDITPPAKKAEGAAKKKGKKPRGKPDKLKLRKVEKAPAPVKKEEETTEAKEPEGKKKKEKKVVSFVNEEEEAPAAKEKAGKKAKATNGTAKSPKKVVVKPSEKYTSKKGKKAKN
jgi:hypothetical protein